MGSSLEGYAYIPKMSHEYLLSFKGGWLQIGQEKTGQRRLG